MAQSLRGAGTIAQDAMRSNSPGFSLRRFRMIFFSFVQVEELFFVLKEAK